MKYILEENLLLALIYSSCGHLEAPGRGKAAPASSSSLPTQSHPHGYSSEGGHAC